MKTNSKLTKRVLAIALAVCMLCSVLVTGIGAGITVKAASSATLSFYFQAPGYWPDASGTKTVTGNGTYSIELDVSSFAGITGLQNACVELIGFDDSDTPDAVDFSNVSMTVDGTEYYSYDYAGNHWQTGEKTVTTNSFADSFADYTWTGSETVVATVTVTGLSFTEEDTSVESDTDTTTSGTDTTTSDTDTDTADIDWTIKTADSGYTAYVVYCDASWGNGKWNPDGVGDAKVNGDGTYSVYYKAPSSPVSGAMVFTVDIVDIISAMEDAGVSPSDVTVSNVKVWVDGKAIDVSQSKVVYGHIETQKNNYRIEIYNPGGGGATGSNPPIDSAELAAVNQQVKVEFTLSGIGSLEGESSEPEEEPEEELKDTVGTKKESGYIHDKGAIFVYTGDKYDIDDFSLATGWAFGAVHEINGKWGDSYFGEGGIAGTGTNEGTKIKGNGIYLKYWEDYRGIGYPAIQLSWDTDRIFYIGDITVYSSDWAIQQVFSVGDGFYRGPAERYEGTGEALLDGSNRWYYFGEGSYHAAVSEDTTTEDTTTEDTTTETLDTSTFTNGDLGLADGEAGAYIMFADESWTNQYWYDGNVYTMNPENVKITGEGDYVVGLTGQASGLAFTALGIRNGEAAFPEYCFTITAMTINGELINFTKPYTSSDDAVETRSNIYNAWVSELPVDARVAYGDLTECSPTVVDPALFASVNEFKVYFTVTAPGTELDYDAKVVETLNNLVADGTLTQDAVDAYIAANEIVVPAA